MLLVDGAVLALVDGLLREAETDRPSTVLIASARALLRTAVAGRVGVTGNRSIRGSG